MSHAPIALSTLLALLLAASTATAAEVSRPTEADEPTVVHIALVIADIDQIDGASQNFSANVFWRARWTDPRLAHDSDEVVSRPLDEVWNPRIEVLNRQRIWSTLPTTVRIAPDGKVTYLQRFWGQLSQPLDLDDFPFDEHRFDIRLVAVGYSPAEVELVPDTEIPSMVLENLSIADWDVVSSELVVETLRLMPSIEHESVTARFSFVASRRGGYFKSKIILPLILIVAMSWVVFWIDPEQAGTQISVSVTTMLTLIAYRFAVGAHLPKISYLTRLDQFILGSTILVFACLLEVVVTSTLASSERGDLARKIDRWCRIGFPAAFGGVIVWSLAI